jgi:hypothetical protein
MSKPVAPAVDCGGWRASADRLGFLGSSPEGFAQSVSRLSTGERAVSLASPSDAESLRISFGNCENASKIDFRRRVVICAHGLFRLCQ